MRRSEAIDRDLCLFLAHYRKQKPSGERWRIVIAGDFIDFIGMSITPREGSLDTEPTVEERAHGLGNASDHARAKLRLVAQRHADVLAELGLFVADGHALTMVHGNHDIEFHWDDVKDDFRALLLGHAKAARPELDDASFLERIEFSQWFFYRDGVAYIEHGHQYDPFCATAHVMSPVSPLDPRRIARSVSDVLLRFVVRPTRGMQEHGHENAGVFDYLSFAFRLGWTGLLALGSRFVSAILEMFRLRREHLSEAANVLRAEHERRVALLGEATRIGKDRLRALLSLQAPPLARSVRGIMASVLLDRLALAMAAMLLLVGVAITSAFYGYALYGGLAVLLGWALLHRHLARARHIDAVAELAVRATKLASLFPAAFVVMGHTHVPVRTDAGAATYINLGSWAEQEDTPRARRTHLVIHSTESTPEAQLYEWESGVGPRRFDA